MPVLHSYRRGTGQESRDPCLRSALDCIPHALHYSSLLQEFATSENAMKAAADREQTLGQLISDAQRVQDILAGAREARVRYDAKV